MNRTTRTSRVAREAGATGGSRPAALSATALDRLAAGTSSDPIPLGTATNAFIATPR